MVLNDLVWFSSGLVRSEWVCFWYIWYLLVWFGIFWYGVICTWFLMVIEVLWCNFGVIWLVLNNLTWFIPVWLGRSWFDLACLGLVWWLDGPSHLSCEIAFHAILSMFFICVSAYHMYMHTCVHICMCVCKDIIHGHICMNVCVWKLYVTLYIYIYIYIYIYSLLFVNNKLLKIWAYYCAIHLDRLSLNVVSLSYAICCFGDHNNQQSAILLEFCYIIFTNTI